MMYTNVMTPYRTNTYVTVPRARAVLFEALLGAMVGFGVAFVMGAFLFSQDPPSRKVLPKPASWTAPRGCRPKPIVYRDYETGDVVTARTTVCEGADL